MKYFIVSVFLGITSLTLNAQNAIPNEGFENWEEAGGLFSGYLDPVGWGTSNEVTNNFGFQTATRAQGGQWVHSGNFALRLETHQAPILNIPVQGGVATSPLIIDIVNQTVEPAGGVPFDLRPTAIRGWYQYFPAGSDSARIGLLLRRWNPASGERDTIAVALFETVDETPGYTLFEAPLQYQSELDPDTMLIGIICSKVVDPAVGTVMYVDDLELVYDELTSVSPPESALISVFPNPSNGTFSCNHPHAFLAEISDTKGRQVATITSNGDQGIFTTYSLKGIYVVRFFNRNGQLLGHSRIAFE